VYCLRTSEISPTIRDALIKRGFVSIRSSNTRKIVLEFEKNRNSFSIFEKMYNKPILRVFTHLLRGDMVKGALTTTQAFDLIENRSFEDTLSKSPIKNIHCKGCRNVIHSYDVYEGRKPITKITCSNCHRRNTPKEWIEKDDWTISLEDCKHYFDQLSDCGFFSSERLGTCFECMDSRTIDLFPSKKIKSLSTTKLQAFGTKMALGWNGT